MLTVVASAIVLPAVVNLAIWFALAARSLLWDLHFLVYRPVPPWLTTVSFAVIVVVGWAALLSLVLWMYWFIWSKEN